MYVFTNKYINEFQSSESDEGMKKILKLSNFLNFFEKRAWDTHNAPKPATENFEKIENSYFGVTLGQDFWLFQNFQLQVWVHCGCPKPFFQKIQKVWKF